MLKLMWSDSCCVQARCDSLSLTATLKQRELGTGTGDILIVQPKADTAGAQLSHCAETNLKMHTD